MPSSRTILLSIAAFCVAAIAVALSLQHYKDMLPCPLCVIQRYLFLAVAVCCLIGAFGGKPKAGAGLALLGSLGGVGVAAKHLYVLANPGFSCGIDPVETALNRIPTAELLPFVFRADGLCEDATAPFVGLSIPQWAGLSFTLVSIALLLVLLRRR